MNSTGQGGAHAHISMFRLLIEKVLSRNRDVMLRQRTEITKALEETFSRLVVGSSMKLSIEIGAHEASYSRKIRRALPESVVMAVEANPAVFKKYSVSLGKLGITYLNSCVGEKQGKRSFNVPVRNGKLAEKMGSLKIDGWTNDTSSFEVDVFPLDAVVPASQERSAIWLDVEGGLCEVLRSGPDTLQRCSLLYAEVESKERWQNQALDFEIFSLLARHGLEPVLCDVQRNFQYNVLCIRLGELDPSLVAREKNRYLNLIAGTLRDGERRYD